MVLITIRYPRVTKSHSECLKLWPAYVCWARGHMKQASDFFVEAIETLKDSEWLSLCVGVMCALIY